MASISGSVAGVICTCIGFCGVHPPWQVSTIGNANAGTLGGMFARTLNWFTLLYALFPLRTSTAHARAKYCVPHSRSLSNVHIVVGPGATATGMLVPTLVVNAMSVAISK